MTKLFTWFFAIMLILAVSACSDNSTNNDDNNIVMGSMKCKVDGQSWQSMNATATKAGSNIVTIGGASTNIATGEVLGVALTITGEIVVGSSNTVTLAQYSVTNINNPMQATLYNSTTPTLNITKVSSTEIEGKFAFTGTTDGGATKKITDGEFKVKFVN